jgi:hypothetical protein
LKLLGDPYVLPTKGLELSFLIVIFSALIIAKIALYFIIGPEIAFLDLVFVQSSKLLYLINALITPY